MLLIGKGSVPVGIRPEMANRHGLIAGATGTGKTVTLQVLAESFSQAGVPVFLSDIKGDLTGISQPAVPGTKIKERIAQLGLDNYTPSSCPVCFWDVFGEQGHPVRTTISEMGPLLLSRLLALNETQTGVMHVVFKIADEQKLMLLDMKDLREMLRHVAENASEYMTQYGAVSKQSVGAIQRALLTLETQGAEQFFGEPAMQVSDFMKCDVDGNGVINILAADKLFRSPSLYSTFLLWMLAELYELLPEAGDIDKPKLVFFFDEAHLLFDDAPKALLDQVEQVVRLIRSKGVGVYFVTQNPIDIPDDVAGQLGNRVQHALRAYTPKEQKAVKAAAETFRPNPAFQVEDVITQLGVGEALVSCLDEKGRPGIVEQALICPPQSKIGPITPAERKAFIETSVFYGHYEQTLDRESAYEILTQRTSQDEHQQAAPYITTNMTRTEMIQAQSAQRNNSNANTQSSVRPRAKRETPARTSKPTRTGSVTSGLGKTASKAVDRVVSSAASQIGRQLGRDLLRGIFGALIKK